MKKYLLSFSLLIVACGFSTAGDGVKVGLKFSPAFSFASVRDKKDGDSMSLSKNGTQFRFVAGPVFEFRLTDNVWFTTGLWYSPRAVRINTNTLHKNGYYVSGSSQYNLQYLMVPLYFKFNTNEITSGLSIYFNLGGTVDFKIVEKSVGSDDAGLMLMAERNNKSLFSVFDASLLLGTGVEYKLGDATILFAGLSYNRGLINTVNPLLESNGMKLYQHVAIKNNLINIDLGIKF
jgi:hypothetical protein